ncbi:MAG: hypothetical protein AAFX05_01960 [Planctomycetota bacterium]
MNQISAVGALAGVACALTLAGTAHAAPIATNCVDFSTDDNGMVIANGQEIDGEFFADFTVSGVGAARLAAFDSTPSGPNDPSGDEDLLVDLGNVLIIQNDNLLSKTGDIFDTVDDDAGGGAVLFSFNSPVTLESIDLIDIDSSAAVTVTMTDGNGLTRTYSVPDNWTFDVESSPLGWDTLDLTSLADQDSEGAGGPATAVEDFGFDANDVVSLEVDFSGSGALDNVKYVPGPATAAMLACSGIAAVTRRRRS